MRFTMFSRRNSAESAGIGTPSADSTAILAPNTVGVGFKFGLNSGFCYSDVKSSVLHSFMSRHIIVSGSMKALKELEGKF